MRYHFPGLGSEIVVGYNSKAELLRRSRPCSQESDESKAFTAAGNFIMYHHTTGYHILLMSKSRPCAIQRKLSLAI